MKTMRLIALLTFVTSSAVAGDGKPGGDWIRQSAFGMDCEPCAVGIERGIKQLAGIARVEVDLQSGLITIDLTADAQPDMAAIRQTIVDNGFTPREAELQLTGQVIEKDGQCELAIGEQRFALAPTETLEYATIAEHHRRLVTVSGSMSSDQVWQIAVNSIAENAN